jgi:hypothetical protein
MPDNNRIGSACWYRMGTSSNHEWKGGRLRHWSTLSSEDGSAPVAIIEDDTTGMCIEVDPHNRICFASIPPD